jgi:protein involved in polysaccharide export with SLBB domain
MSNPELNLADLEEGQVFGLTTGQAPELIIWQVKVEKLAENPVCHISEVQPDGSLAPPYIGEVLGSSPPEVQSSSHTDRLARLARGVLKKGHLVTCLWLDDSTRDYSRGLGYLNTPVAEVRLP